MVNFLDNNMVYMTYPVYRIGTCINDNADIVVPPSHTRLPRHIRIRASRRISCKANNISRPYFYRTKSKVK